MHSRFGRTLIELDHDSSTRYDQIEVAAWRLGPPKPGHDDEVDLRDRARVDGDVSG